MKKLLVCFFLLLVSFSLQGCLLDELWSVMKRAWGTTNKIINVPFKDKTQKSYSPSRISREGWKWGNFVILRLKEEYSDNVQLINYYGPDDTEEVRYFYFLVDRRKNMLSRRKRFLRNTANNKDATLIFYGEYETFPDDNDVEIYVSLYSWRNKVIQTRIVSVDSSDREDITEKMARTLRNMIEDHTN